MTTLELIITTLYGGITPAPILTAFYFTYPFLWARKDKISVSFAVLMLFSLYSLFLIPGILFSQIHHQGIFNRLSINETSEVLKSEDSLLNDYRDSINDLKLFTYDDCLINNVSRNSLNEVYTLVCINEKSQRYITTITQVFKTKQTKVRVNYIKEDSSQIHKYSLIGLNVEDYLKGFGIDSILEQETNKSIAKRYSIVFSEDIDWKAFESKELIASKEFIPRMVLVSRYIEHNNSFYIFSKR